MLEIGSLVNGKFKILNEVGRGGMSIVYLAADENASKQWAVKEVRKDALKDFEVVQQGFSAETDILKKLSHPNLPTIVDVIDKEDSFIIIMDYIEGNSLHKALEEYGALPQDLVITWAMQLCDVLGYLHSRTPAIIYHDMKPANIMLKPDGNIALIDFGTARELKETHLTDTVSLGTEGYAAPEQFGEMGQTDVRTDIYSLGATLYHLVTGVNPCEPPYEMKPIRDINPSLSMGLERIIQKCTQHDPNDRYQSAAELMCALEHCEEIDRLYRKKQKGKLFKFISCLAFTLVFAAISFLGYFSAEIHSAVIIGGAILTGILFVGSVLLFFLLKIPTVIGELSGANKRKPIANSGSRIQAPSLGASGAGQIGTAQYERPKGLGDTAVLSEKTANGPKTTVLSAQTVCNEFVIEYEITYIHTDEVIS